MSKINLSSATIEALNVFLDKDELSLDIELLDDAMDDYLEMHCDDIDGDEAKRRLDMASSLRRVSKNFTQLLNAMNDGKE
ncbi:MAG: hypothetical protein E7104_00530 [Prevotella sp.]|jgi:hypothetical protein|nr:hypothetical protein [Prevotella sp.]